MEKGHIRSILVILGSAAGFAVAPRFQQVWIWSALAISGQSGHSVTVIVWAMDSILDKHSSVKHFGSVHFASPALTNVSYWSLLIAYMKALNYMGLPFVIHSSVLRKLNR
jgi:hypothetical protein